MRYFKYRANVDDSKGFCRDIITLINDELYASPFCDLNDPFEAIYNDLISTSLETIRKVANVKVENVTKEWDNLQAFNKRLGIYSLVGSPGEPNNELMWSFYANSHRGFCIEYDIDKLVMSEPNRKNVDVVPVLYRRKPPRISIEDIYSYNRVIQKMFGSKSTRWKHEGEIRLVYNESGLKKYYPQSLKAIYFGYKMPEEYREQIIEGLINKDVVFYQMERVPGTYQLKAVYICSNSRGIPELFQTSDYELLSYSKNNIVENFHICFKPETISKEVLMSFVQWYRQKYSVKDKSNVFLYDSPTIKNLIDKYPLNEREDAILATHTIAASFFELPGEVQLYPYK